MRTQAELVGLGPAAAQRQATQTTTRAVRTLRTVWSACPVVGGPRLGGLSLYTYPYKTPKNERLFNHREPAGCGPLTGGHFGITVRLWLVRLGVWPASSVAQPAESLASCALPAYRTVPGLTTSLCVTKYED